MKKIEATIEAANMFTKDSCISFFDKKSNVIFLAKKINFLKDILSSKKILCHIFFMNFSHLVDGDIKRQGRFDRKENDWYI